MLINIVIIGLFQSTLALFHHHHKAPTHTKIHVCLTPPTTLQKVQKHIIECQHEVKTNIFNEAFSLINDHAFHHPDDHATIDVHGHDEFAHRNFTLTEQEILHFFENHEYPKGVAGEISAGSGPLGSSLEVSHEKQPVSHEESHEQHNQPALDPIVHQPVHDPIHQYPQHHPHLQPHPNQYHRNPHPYGWQRPLPIENFYKKTEDAQFNPNRPEQAQHFLRALTPKRNPYAYFNVNDGEQVKINDRPRRSIHELELHSESHSGEIPHPTTASFKDKRIAGCLMHCLYEKDHAIDPHTGYPTLDGLVNFYSDGVHEHGFFMTTLRSVDYCLKGASHKYHINRHHKPSAEISCDLAFDIFDCVSDKITEYCSKHHYHDDEHHYHHDEHLHKGHHLPHSDEHAIDPHPHHHNGQFDDEYHDDEAYYYYNK
ncbi:histidine-rich glycoprotein [Contarinia nasturtii]|uniref:histidine-rich glycoprotein n=1 Tax=Contarinia nasturtii TaxID=265458 RepID=UPI0012D4059F|nr:histidine-rich glycoprotein [Contarinia nasturtii]XP_031640647.1 histidine-rich glycoprotein [Contarinia nasturtii]